MYFRVQTRVHSLVKLMKWFNVDVWLIVSSGTSNSTGHDLQDFRDIDFWRNPREGILNGEQQYWEVTAKKKWVIVFNFENNHILSHWPFPFQMRIQWFMVPSIFWIFRHFSTNLGFSSHSRTHKKKTYD